MMNTNILLKQFIIWLYLLNKLGRICQTEHVQVVGNGSLLEQQYPMLEDTHLFNI